jgi:putative hydrolase of HD superfamily
MDWFVKLLDIVDSTGNIPRVGWVQRGVSLHEAETVGEHTLLASYVALFLARRLRTMGISIDPNRCVTMALIHDAHEALLGNAGSLLRESLEWRSIEVEAFGRLDVLSEFRGEFMEYRFASTLEGLIAYLADKLATLIRACHYRRRGYPTDELVRNYARVVMEIADNLPKEGVGFVRGSLDSLITWCNQGSVTSTPGQ